MLKLPGENFRFRSFRVLHDMVCRENASGGTADMVAAPPFCFPLLLRHDVFSVEQLSSTVSEAGTNFISDKRLGQSFYNRVDYLTDRIADESEIRAIHALSTLFTATLPTMASGTRLPGPVERVPASILYDPYPYSVASTRLSGKQSGLLPNAVSFAVQPSVPVWPSKNPNDPESDGGAAHDPQ